MTISINTHTPAELATAIQKINAEDSPYGFNVRLFTPPAKTRNGYNVSYFLWVDIPPARRTIMYYPSKPGLNHKYDQVEVPFPWVSMLLCVSNSTMMNITPMQVYHTRERVQDHLVDGNIQPWLGNHSLSTVCFGGYNPPPADTPLEDALGFFFNHYFSSTFNHSTAPYLTSPVMYHLALMAGHAQTCSEFDKFVGGKCPDHPSQLCCCRTGWQVNPITSTAVHAAYKYLSRHEDFASAVPLFFDAVTKNITYLDYVGTYSMFHGVNSSSLSPFEFKILFELENADQYRDLIASGDYDNSPWYMFQRSVTDSNTTYKFNDVQLRQVHGENKWAVSLEAILSEKDTVDVLAGKTTVAREVNEDTKQRYDELLYYLTGKNS